MESFERQRNSSERQFKCERVNCTLQCFILATSWSHLDSISVHFDCVVESVGQIDGVHVLPTNDKSLGSHSVEENLLEII